MLVDTPLQYRSSYGRDYQGNETRSRGRGVLDDMDGLGRDRCGVGFTQRDSDWQIIDGLLLLTIYFSSGLCPLLLTRFAPNHPRHCLPP